MKSEQQARNSRDLSDDKIMAILEYYLSLHEVDEVFTAIFDNQVEVADVIELIERFEFTEPEA